MDSSYRAGSILLRDSHPLGSDEVVATKELLKTLELGVRGQVGENAEAWAQIKLLRNT
jgi:16S rRNA C1402 (ribose-2'-O) methylase RsmI